MKKNLLAIAAFALLLTSCETKLVEKVDLIPLAENVEIHKGAFPLSSRPLRISFSVDIQ